MRPFVLLLAGCLISWSAFAQRGGHGGGGSRGGGGGISHAGGGISHAGGGFSRGGVGAGRMGSGFRGGYGGYRNGGFRGGGFRYGGYRNGFRYGWFGGRWGWYPGYYGAYWDPFWSDWDTYPSYGYTGYSDPYAYANSYGAPAYSDQPPVIVNQAFPYASAPPPPAEPPPAPAVREYPGPPMEHSSAATPVLYLIALKNNAILAALTYWSEHGELHYVGMDHKMKEIPISSIDQDLTDRLNRERNVPFKIS